jgi:hypothetical protein
LFLRIVEPASASSRRAEARRRCPPGCSTSPLRPGICRRAFGIHFPLYLRATVGSATLWPSGLQQYLCRCRSLRRLAAAKSSGDGVQPQEPAAGDRLNTKFQLLESFRLGAQRGQEGAVHFCAEPGAALLRCCSSSNPDGISNDMANCSLFCQPVTTSPWPFILACCPATTDLGPGPKLQVGVGRLAAPR